MVVEVVVVAVLGAGLGDVAAVVVVAWTSMRGESLLMVGLVGKVATGLTGAFWIVSVGLELGPGAGELVCAWAMVLAANMTATAQIRDLKRLGINVNGS